MPVWVMGGLVDWRPASSIPWQPSGWPPMVMVYDTTMEFLPRELKMVGR